MSEPATSPEAEPRCYPLPDPDWPPGPTPGWPPVTAGQVYESLRDGSRWRIEEVPGLIDNRLLVKNVDPAEPGLRTPRVGVDRAVFLKAHKLVIDPNRPTLPDARPAKVEVSQRIEVGSAVRLNGGGPIMTVLSIDQYCLASCMYAPEYGTDGSLRTVPVPVAALMVVLPPPV